MSYSGLAPGSTVTFTCEPGYIMVSGDAVRTCHESGGWTGTQPKCQVQNCVTLQNNATGKLKSGLYQINRGGRNFHIYCNYGDGDGYVYISTSIPSDVDLNMASLSDDSSHVKVIHRRQNGSQYEAKIQQIAAFNTLPVSVQFNKHDGY
ncbi:CUB and sushi domain-containing protein 3-like [Dreissena polymorpha]|nr:CUB and sushi domain-containing protein 3-like [Dreissena polymorpha]